MTQSLEWRRQVGADTLLRDFNEPEVMTKYYPGGLLGVAKDGCPIWVEPMGRGDLRGNLNILRVVSIFVGFVVHPFGSVSVFSLI